MGHDSISHDVAVATTKLIAEELSRFCAAPLPRPAVTLIFQVIRASTEKALELARRGVGPPSNN